MKLQPEQLASLEKIAATSGILDLSDRCIYDEDLPKIIEDVNASKNITTLILRQNNIRDNQHILGRLMNILVLDLSYNNISDVVLSVLFSATSKLQEINLSCNAIHDNGAQTVLAYARTHTFFRANLKNNSITDPELIAEAKGISRVTI